MNVPRLSTNATYVNHGGIGFATDSSGVIRFAEVDAQRPLRLIAPFDGGQVIGECAAPVNGWTAAALAEALNARRSEILSFAPVDAYLGDSWIGSTEV